MKLEPLSAAWLAVFFYRWDRDWVAAHHPVSGSGFSWLYACRRFPATVR